MAPKMSEFAYSQFSLPTIASNTRAFFQAVFTKSSIGFHSVTLTANDIPPLLNCESTYREFKSRIFEGDEMKFEEFLIDSETNDDSLEVRLLHPTQGLTAYLVCKQPINPKQPEAQSTFWVEIEGYRKAIDAYENSFELLAQSILSRNNQLESQNEQAVRVMQLVKHLISEFERGNAERPIDERLSESSLMLKAILALEESPVKVSRIQFSDLFPSQLEDFKFDPEIVIIADLNKLSLVANLLLEDTNCPGYSLNRIESEDRVRLCLTPHERLISGLHSASRMTLLEHLAKQHRGYFRVERSGNVIFDFGDGSVE